MMKEATLKSSSKKLSQQMVSMHTQFIMLTFSIHVEAAEHCVKNNILLIFNP